MLFNIHFQNNITIGKIKETLIIHDLKAAFNDYLHIKGRLSVISRNTPLHLEEALRVKTKTAAWETNRVIDDLKRQSKGLLENSKLKLIRQFSECANLCRERTLSSIGAMVVSDKFNKKHFAEWLVQLLIV